MCVYVRAPMCESLCVCVCLCLYLYLSLSVILSIYLSVFPLCISSSLPCACLTCLATLGLTLSDCYLMPCSRNLQAVIAAAHPAVFLP